MAHAHTWSDDPASLLRAGEGFSLETVDPRSTPGFRGSKSDGEKTLARGDSTLATLQEKLFANGLSGDRRRVLLVLQGMDTAGKGGIVRHVVGSVDPEGVTRAAFKKPTPEELSHDFLWRIRNALPPAGQLGVFDRSHYEDVLAVKVLSLVEPHVVDERYGLINDFEREIAADGTILVKVMLHISPDEQRKRLEARLEHPDKYWKYNPGDVDSRKLWHPYQEAYQTVFERTSTGTAPWSVVPADHKWYARIAVQRLLIDALENLGQGWPAADFDVETEKRRLAAS